MISLTLRGIVKKEVVRIEFNEHISRQKSGVTMRSLFEALPVSIAKANVRLSGIREKPSWKVTGTSSGRHIGGRAGTRWDHTHRFSGH